MDELGKCNEDWENVSVCAWTLGEFSEITENTAENFPSHSLEKQGLPTFIDTCTAKGALDYDSSLTKTNRSTKGVEFSLTEILMTNNIPEQKIAISDLDRIDYIRNLRRPPLNCNDRTRMLPIHMRSKLRHLWSTSRSEPKTDSMPQHSTSTKIAPPRPGVRSDVSYFRDLRKLSVPNMVEQNPRLDTLAPETKTALPCVLNTNVDQPESLNTALTGGQMRNLITCKSKASSAPTGMELRKLVISKTSDNILECHQSEAADKNTMMPEPSFFVSPHDSNPKCDPMMPIDLAVQVQSRLARKNRSENKENDKVLNVSRDTNS